MKLLLLVIGVSLLGVVSSNPTHASCRLTWTFGMTDCPTVFKALIDQMNKWNKSYPCGTSEKCLYEVKSQTASTAIKATHTTPVKHYVDDLTFSLNATSSSACTVNGFSTSETWYAVLDYGTNYCNLRNVVDGAGLSKNPGFKEDTSDSICTQFSSKNCEKY